LSAGRVKGFLHYRGVLGGCAAGLRGCPAGAGSRLIVRRLRPRPRRAADRRSRANRPRDPRRVHPGLGAGENRECGAARDPPQPGSSRAST